MVVKILGWRPWPPNSTRKFKVSLRVHSLEGISQDTNSDLKEFSSTTNGTATITPNAVMMIKVNWKGPTTGLGHRLRGSQKRARTSERAFEHGHHINFQEDFEHLCALTLAKDAGFLPFDVHFLIIQVREKSKATVLGRASMNLGDLAPVNQEIMKHTKRLSVVPLEPVLMQKHVASLVVSINFEEVRLHESAGMERFGPPSLHCLGGPLICDQQIRVMYEKKIKDMKRSVSKTSGEIDNIMCNGKLSTTSEESSSDIGDIYDTDSLDDPEEDKASVGEAKMILQSYGPLAGVNLFIEGALPKLTDNTRHVEENLSSSTSSKAYSETSSSETSMSDSDQSTRMRSLLSWKKRKLSFRSRAAARGEPLLNKAYGEDGGDDIDRDRRLSGCPIEPCCSPNEERAMLSSAVSECLDFGVELFAIGSWEKKDFVSRDGNMKLSTSVFFASLDQRSERAAGESACTALVAVIADWLHKNPDCMPIKAEYDTLIREGSAEWRKLFDIEAYRSKFLDGHFDLETVINARIRPLAVDHEHSFIGFFQPDGLDDTYNNVLQGAKSFDEIWAAIEHSFTSQLDGSLQPAVYIVSWNDHFFLLKVCKEAYYIIDTLGERLFEGCNQAYVLRFDDETSLTHVPKPAVKEPKDKKEISPESSDTKTEEDPLPQSQEANIPKEEKNEDKMQSEEKDNNNVPVEYKAKHACKEFVKGFFAALPIRELQTDLKKGLVGENALHQRLQIEFHFTSLDEMIPIYCNGSL
ncbi:hypothetical protein L7F22_012174 [Adiantum nelumboides]|nr:hypothetical protein [Adiantum nelumboides]